MQTSLKNLNRLELITGFPEDEPVVLDIAPTMKSITHEGRRYWRTTIRRIFDDGTEGATYLSEGYAQEKARRLKETAAR